MNLLFTGASGFLGKSLYPLLKDKYDITTIGIAPEDNLSVNLAYEKPVFQQYFEYVLHAAGKAHSVPKTEAEEKVFFDVNLQGTKNLCLGLEESALPKAFIFISTVAVYGCDYGENISEEHPLNGITPYALSKIEAEKFLIDWCKEKKVKLSIIRPSLIAGPNPPGNLGTMIKGIKSGRYFSVAGGETRKSVLMVHDIANLIPLLIEKGGIYNVCDSQHPSFRELEKLICKQLHKSLPLNIPNWMANCMAKVGDCLGRNAPINSLKLKKITGTLTFSNEKAIQELGWRPLDVLDNFNIE